MYPVFQFIPIPIVYYHCSSSYGLSLSIFGKQRWSKLHSTWMATGGKLASPLMLNNISLQCHVLYRDQ
uniref:Uncharacterized protein n=1 Tax=Oryza rufipogon TaxID=4529 RepID=A0A0E0QJQ3_ORYRU